MKSSRSTHTRAGFRARDLKCESRPPTVTHEAVGSLAISLVANAVQAGVLLDLPAALTAFFAAMPAILFAVMRRRMGRMLIDERGVDKTHLLAKAYWK